MQGTTFSKAKHFAGLDGLRFISISFVVLHHLFTFKANFGYNQYDYPVLGLIGFYGIQFFFMGSGFLITYLLLHEHREFKTINLKNFFLRRILRIWPGYFLLIVLFLLAYKLPFFNIPGTTATYLANDYRTSNIFFLSFLPHIQPFLFPTAPFIHHTYTIGIEEQFYIIWGLLFYFFKKYAYTIFWFILLSMPLLNFFHQIAHTYPAESRPVAIQYFNAAVTYLKYSRFSTFAIGSLFGYAYFFQKNWIHIFKNPFVQVILYGIIFISIFFDIHIPFMDYEYMSLLMACLLLTATFKKESLINYSERTISYLGKVSYGVYLFHIFAIVFACKLLRLFLPLESGIWVTLLLCVLTLGISILFGMLSYHFFEVFFLRLKKKFQSTFTHQPKV